MNAHSTSPTEIPLHGRPARCLRVVISRDVVFPLRELDLFLLDGEVCAENAASDFSAVLAVAEVAAALGAEEVGIVYFYGHSVAEAAAFHGAREGIGTCVGWGCGSEGSRWYVVDQRRVRGNAFSVS